MDSGIDSARSSQNTPLNTDTNPNLSPPHLALYHTAKDSLSSLQKIISDLSPILQLIDNENQILCTAIDNKVYLEDESGINNTINNKSSNGISLSNINNSNDRGKVVSGSSSNSNSLSSIFREGLICV